MRKRVLFVGAHPDDIELGCGGTIFKHRGDWEIHTLTLCSGGLAPGAEDLIDAHRAALCGLGAFSNNVRFASGTFTPSALEESRQRVWEEIHSTAERIGPEKVFVPAPDDHQDHATVYREALRSFQDVSVFTYHIPRSAPAPLSGYYEALDASAVAAKLAALRHYSCYGQSGRPIAYCFRPENITAALRANGVYIGAEFAEVFGVVRLVKR